ncbi:MAG: pyridoxamine 5'-phosphate oxidase family protein [Acidiferrobacterales bacterium]
MAKFYECLNAGLREFIRSQHVFFVATAPRSGRLNISPKGADTFRIIDDARVAYLDITGSGNETAAHLLDDGRLTIMFCSFDQDPLIVRLYGHGRALCPGEEGWSDLFRHFAPFPGMRQIMSLQIESVQTSCGYAVPRYHYEGERDTYLRWAEKKGVEGLAAYQAEKNRLSIDGLPTGLHEKTGTGYVREDSPDVSDAS